VQGSKNFLKFLNSFFVLEMWWTGSMAHEPLATLVHCGPRTGHNGWLVGGQPTGCYGSSALVGGRRGGRGR
jgi:hypothetical protein